MVVKFLRILVIQGFRSISSSYLVVTNLYKRLNDKLLNSFVLFTCIPICLLQYLEDFERFLCQWTEGGSLKGLASCNLYF